MDIVNGFTPPRANASCSVGAFGVVRATPKDVADLRKNPGPEYAGAIPVSLLNHSDEQAVTALSAVLHAVHDFGLAGQSFTDWTVVAAPRFAGRVFIAGSFDRYRRLGPLSVSPIIIPFYSQHAVSSMISMALRIHGPSVGAGAGYNGFVQALLVGLALRQENDSPGVWVVATGWDPELVPDAAEDAPTPVCHAAALALLPDEAGAHGSCLRLVPRAAARAERDEPTLSELVRFMAGETDGRTRSWSCPAGGEWELQLQLPAVGGQLSAAG
jgi:hypothetical protein